MFFDTHSGGEDNGSSSSSSSSELLVGTTPHDALYTALSPVNYRDKHLSPYANRTSPTTQKCMYMIIVPLFLFNLLFHFYLIAMISGIKCIRINIFRRLKVKLKSILLTATTLPLIRLRPQREELRL